MCRLSYAYSRNKPCTLWEQFTLTCARNLHNKPQWQTTLNCACLLPNTVWWLITRITLTSAGHLHNANGESGSWQDSGESWLSVVADHPVKRTSHCNSPQDTGTAGTKHTTHMSGCRCRELLTATTGTAGTKHTSGCRRRELLTATTDTAGTKHTTHT